MTLYGALIAVKKVIIHSSTLYFRLAMDNFPIRVYINNNILK
jgi:hypothetical protein